MPGKMGEQISMKSVSAHSRLKPCMTPKVGASSQPNAVWGPPQIRLLAGRRIAIGLILALAACNGDVEHAPAARAQNPTNQPPATQAASSPEQNPTPKPKNTALRPLSAPLVEAFQLIRQNQTGAARIRLAKHLKQYPRDAQATFLFGLSYHREKKYAQAVPHFENAIELDPEYFQTYHFLGWSCYYLGEPERSRRAFEAYLEHHPEEPDTEFALGLIELDADRLDEAEKRFRRSIGFIAKQARAKGAQADLHGLSKAHARLGELHERRGSLKEARADLETAVKLYPDNYEAFYKLYRVLVRLGEEEQATLVHQQYLAAKDRVRPEGGFPE